MVRSYDVAVASLALDVPHKWIDNLLSRHRIPGVAQERQGITRRLSIRSLVTLAIVRELSVHLRIPIGQAVDIATRLTASGDTQLTFSEGTLLVAADQAALSQRITDRLADAVESAPRRRRGRRSAATSKRH